jgi:NTE family protein
MPGKEGDVTIRTLILSGGGGRGAFHAGVYDYLHNHYPYNEEKRWDPDIVVGTSIGAVNGAAIVQGISPQALGNFWVNLEARHIEGLPPGMRGLAHRGARQFLRRLLRVPLDRVKPEQATSPPFQEAWIPLPIGPRWLSDLLIGRWSNFLDTGPLRETLTSKLGLDRDKIAASEKTLLINATDVRTGERVTFSNHDIRSRRDGGPRADVVTGIDIIHILASCSIPLVYPWTHDGERIYWDGAIVCNTPLGAALDAARDRPVEEPMEAVVVLMTPWRERGEDPKAREQGLPQDIEEALTWILDWIMLATFRVELGMTEAFNELARQQQEAGQPVTYRPVRVVIVAAKEFLPLKRIIDYNKKDSQDLINWGRDAAKEAFKEHFGTEEPQAV